MDRELEKISGFYVPKRYITIFLGFLGMSHLFAMRVNLSVTMVAMVNHTESASLINRSLECAMLMYNTTSHLSHKRGQYNWDPKMQSLVLEAFFYGYILTQIPGGYLTARFGAKWYFGGGIFTLSLLTLLTPVSATMGPVVLIAARFFEGIVTGPALPAMTMLLSQWAPVLERSRLSALIFSGFQLGCVVSMALSGWLSSSYLSGGWPSAFYFFGATGCIWFIFWTFFVYESPAVHPTISKEELSYFEQPPINTSQKKPPVPWKCILTSAPVWAITVAHFGDSMGLHVYLIELPSYLSSVLHFDITQNGALSSLPFIMQVLTGSIASIAADKLRSSGKLNITIIRKIMNSIGQVGPAICLLLLTTTGCKPRLAVSLLTLGLGLNGFAYSGYNVTHVDMSSAFPGTLYGITNTVSNLCGVIVPAMVAALTSDGATIRNWNKVFYITSASYIGGAVFYCAFASAEQQPWGRGLEQEEDKWRKQSAVNLEKVKGEK